MYEYFSLLSNQFLLVRIHLLNYGKCSVYNTYSKRDAALNEYGLKRIKSIWCSSTKCNRIRAQRL